MSDQSESPEFVVFREFFISLRSNLEMLVGETVEWDKPYPREAPIEKEDSIRVLVKVQGPKEKHDLLLSFDFDSLMTLHGHMYGGDVEIDPENPSESMQDLAMEIINIAYNTTLAALTDKYGIDSEMESPNIVSEEFVASGKFVVLPLVCKGCNLDFAMKVA